MKWGFTKTLRCLGIKVSVNAVHTTLKCGSYSACAAMEQQPHCNSCNSLCFLLSVPVCFTKCTCIAYRTSWEYRGHLWTRCYDDIHVMSIYCGENLYIPTVYTNVNNIVIIKKRFYIVPAISKFVKRLRCSRKFNVYIP